MEIVFAVDRVLRALKMAPAMKAKRHQRQSAHGATHPKISLTLKSRKRECLKSANS